MNDQDKISHPISAVIYRRVAVTDELSSDKLEGQEQRCRDYADKHQCDVVAVFTDRGSGTDTDRPGMNKMLAFLRDRKSIDTIILIDDISRLARSAHAHMHFLGEFAKIGAVLQSRCDFNASTTRPESAAIGAPAPL